MRTRRIRSDGEIVDQWFDHPGPVIRELRPKPLDTRLALTGAIPDFTNGAYDEVRFKLDMEVSQSTGIAVYIEEEPTK